MNNSESFNKLIDEFLRKDDKYELQINNFKQFLKDRLLEEKVFNLNESHIDQYFIYSCDSKIGAETTLTSHISALKSLFDFLISKNFKFAELNGYISTTGFKESLSAKLEKTFSKPILNNTLVNSILYKMDSYIEDNIKRVFSSETQKRKYFEIMIARLYVKLSLILPLKTSQMLNLRLLDIMTNDVRTIEYNGIIIKIPNSLREQIITTIKFAQDEFSNKYLETYKIFEYLYYSISKKPSSSEISSSLTKAYKELKITEMLKQKTGGKKDKYIYPAECYKITTILNMLENGVNIVYLKKLTGLDISTLVSDFDFEKDIKPKDNLSVNINNGIISLDYFTYI